MKKKEEEAAYDVVLRLHKIENFKMMSLKTNSRFLKIVAIDLVLCI